ncbi:MAG: ATP-binding cassette domain-containing protein [Candidatus Aminicenantes bacterium]|nr:ATP-binding cassette domain-containing protein [Candidatus Aminicenantes bacterium]
MQEHKALEVRDLHKSFKTGFMGKKTKVLRGISLDVKKGEIFGYLGPNGAGKTSTLKCLLGLIFPDRGNIKIFGFDHLSMKAKQKTGFLPENPYFYDYLTASEFLNFYSKLFEKQKTEQTPDLLRLVGLENKGDIQLRKFSKGMLQRMALAQALINDPELLLLDEPLGGLDPIGRKEIRDIILNLKERGKTIFLSSHILQDIEMICDRVAVLVNGEVINQGRLHDLVSQEILFTEITVSQLSNKDLESFGKTLSHYGDKSLIQIFDQNKVNQILQFINEKNGKVHSLVPRTQSLEDIFVGMVKQK